MALVVFLKGVNVGGHRTFRPSALAAQMKDLDVVSIGAAGTFVVRQRISQARLRTEFAARLPFETEIAICSGRDVQKLIAKDPFSEQPVRRDLVPFVSVLCAKPSAMPAIPLQLPPKGPWLLKILAVDGRFVLGVYRRQMGVLRHLGALDKLFGASLTTRNWNTMNAIAKALAKRL